MPNGCGFRRPLKRMSMWVSPSSELWESVMPEAPNRESRCAQRKGGWEEEARSVLKTKREGEGRRKGGR